MLEHVSVCVSLQSLAPEQASVLFDADAIVDVKVFAQQFAADVHDVRVMQHVANTQVVLGIVHSYI